MTVGPDDGATLAAWPRRLHRRAVSSFRSSRGCRASGRSTRLPVEERAASLAKRSIKKESKLFALDLAIRIIDLTTLEGSDTPGKVAALCSKAMRPDPVDPTVPPVAAICVYPNLVPVATEKLGDSGVKVAAVATGFPSGQYPLEIKLADVRSRGRARRRRDRHGHRSRRVPLRPLREGLRRDRPRKEAARDLHLKVILETGELGTYDIVRRASLLAMAAGADFIKTSTGKISPAATLPVALVMLEAIRDLHDETGRASGSSPPAGCAPRSRPCSTSCSSTRRSGPTG